jgi:ketosteroid isomerase-like protein
MPDPDAIVAAVEAAYGSAYSDADPKRLTALFAEDATVQTEWGPVLDGRDEATRGLIALFAAVYDP